MKTLTMKLIATSLVICTAPILWANSSLDLPRTDELVKSAEMKGDLERIHNNYFLAISYYRQALRADPRNPSLLNKIGISELKLGDRGPARKYFSQALKADPKNISALNNLGAVAYLDKKYKPAVKYLKQALELDESSAPAHLNLAEAWLGMGEVDRAMTEYARAIELDADILSDSATGVSARVSTPEQRARVDYLIAKAYAKRGNLDGALEYLGRAKELRFAELSRVYKDQEFASLWMDPRLEKIIKR
ncbi:tetratricopeptide repeat protein [Telmatobacter sp. DSM 110680]|uniref:Tetratricopeptide repeat protein n=1 Tax=Telmatobacter sp. DSM 110680 TaxID=3036704 RepID=A0AAU7DMU5_9BACT